VQIVDYDATTNRMFVPLKPERMGTVFEPKDPYANGPASAGAYNDMLLGDPNFHAQNVYAIVMRTLAHFERALGRRASWSFGGHQLKVAPHAFAEANAFYSKAEEALLFGYFAGKNGQTVLNCLSHDIVAHETTHALVDGMRPRYMEPSSPDQAAFHEGFADVVALLSIFSLRDVVDYAVNKAGDGSSEKIVNLSRYTIKNLKKGVLLGLGEQFGEGMSGVHGSALRQSVTIEPSPGLKDTEEYLEEHRRGELLVAAMLHAFVKAYEARLKTLGRDTNGRLPAMRVAEEGADIAERMLTMSIRALDYTPPVDLSFEDYLSAMVTSDLEIRPDDSRYNLRKHLLDGFAAFGFTPASSHIDKGCWKPAPSGLIYNFVHREAMQRDRDEVFRFLWDNRDRSRLNLCDEAYTTVGAVRPCLRVDQDGFTLRETVADYVQILTVPSTEIGSIPIPDTKDRITLPEGIPWQSVRLYGGGSLIFDEFGHLKYHIHNALLNPKRQNRRLQHLVNSGYFFRRGVRAQGFSGLHMKGMAPDLPSVTRELKPW
jgi:hypothetical protein